MIFLTFNDAYSGIYQGQVIEVCKTLGQVSGERVTLVALVSVRDFRAQRRLIRRAMPSARVLPMFPGVALWKYNRVLLSWIRLFSARQTIWARGPFACNLALMLKKKGKARRVLFDARGAYEAEFNEYDLVGDSNLKEDIAGIEKTALEKSDGQLAVSQKLVDWWKERYNFTVRKCQVIPCTLAEHFDDPLPPAPAINEIRRGMDYSPTDIILVYSGSSAGWQSFELIDKLLFEWMTVNPAVKLLFLTKHPPTQSKTFSRFGERIRQIWVQPAEVRNILLAADYGLLIREPSVTNRVSSPVKFAEYLASGLQVIISEEIGDFTEFVKQNNCGHLLAGNLSFRPAAYEKKTAINGLARETFSKRSSSILNRYSALLQE
jgi:hypothetical protein